MKRLLLAWLILLLFSNIALARSIGSVPSDSGQANDSMIDIPVNFWINQKFIVLEKSKQLQQYDFMDFGTAADKYTHPKYKDFAGKTLTVVKVEKDYSEYRVFFEEEQTKKVYQATTYDERISGIALARDMDFAKQWVGKTIYAKTRYIQTYDDNSGKFGKVSISIGDPLNVIDVWWGFDEMQPLWLIIQTNKNEQGFIPIRYSWTNIYKSWWNDKRPWDNSFFENNPREVYGWDELMWSMINERKVQIGMNKTQALLSWGEPKKVNIDINSGTVREQWVYDSGYLYFNDEILSTIQSR